MSGDCQTVCVTGVGCCQNLEVERGYLLGERVRIGERLGLSVVKGSESGVNVLLEGVRGWYLTSPLL